MDSVLGISLPCWVTGPELADENESTPLVCVCVCVCVCVNSAFGFHCDYLAAAAAAKSLRPTLCDPRLLSGSSVPGILQARTLPPIKIH